MTRPARLNIVIPQRCLPSRSRLPRLIIGLWALLAYVFAACQPAADNPPPTLAASYMLEVLHGSGGGRYQAGSTVHVWADPYQPGWTFDQWKGQTEPVPDVRSMHAILTMPSRDIRIEATYKPIPLWSASFANMFDRNMYYYFPPADDKGVILFFHGSGEDAREWSDLGAERRHFFDDVVAEGYAVIAINSADRVTSQWNLDVPPDPNPDLEAVEAILTAFRAEGQIPAQIPAYAVGVSRGGRFATLVSATLNLRATAIWVGAGNEEIMPTTTVPTIWCLADHDPIIDRQEAFSQYRQLVARGVDAVFHVNPQTPLHPQYFVNNAGIDKTASERLFAELAWQGYLDESYFLIDNPRLSKWERHVGLAYSEAIRLDIQDRLMVAYAEHAFYSECDHRVLDFFDAHP